jgi:hypothetical protein
LTDSRKSDKKDVFVNFGKGKNIYMRAYICMTIMLLACTFSFWLGTTVQKEEMMVSAMEDTQIEATAEQEVTEETTSETEITDEKQGVVESEETEPEAAEPEDPFADLDKTQIVLVNKTHKLPEDY